MATTKLTLSMKPEVVYRAKKYAKEKNISLSRLIQDYLAQLSEPGPEPDKNINKDILALTGILKEKYPDEVDLKEEKYQYLKQKYDL
ncbi:DUF6364 family protein [Daejeonella sp.]|uniref:DUF6364 family protein n=1 Tax=Daejeonella sp. TaxID=2805397 RepID=UPI0039839E3C